MLLGCRHLSKNNRLLQLSRPRTTLVYRLYIEKYKPPKCPNEEQQVQSIPTTIRRRTVIPGQHVRRERRIGSRVRMAVDASILIWSPHKLFRSSAFSILRSQFCFK